MITIISPKKIPYTPKDAVIDAFDLSQKGYSKFVVFASSCTGDFFEKANACLNVQKDGDGYIISTLPSAKAEESPEVQPAIRIGEGALDEMYVVQPAVEKVQQPPTLEEKDIRGTSSSPSSPQSIFSKLGETFGFPNFFGTLDELAGECAPQQEQKSPLIDVLEWHKFISIFQLNPNLAPSLKKAIENAIVLGNQNTVNFNAFLGYLNTNFGQLGMFVKMIVEFQLRGNPNTTFWKTVRVLFSDPPSEYKDQERYAKEILEAAANTEKN
jgi:hypothetical protein